MDGYATVLAKTRYGNNQYSNRNSTLYIHYMVDHRRDMAISSIGIDEYDKYVVALHRGDGAKFIDDLERTRPKESKERESHWQNLITNGSKVFVYRKNVYENIFSEVLERLFTVRFSNYNPANFAENNGIDHLGNRYWWLAKWPMEIHLDLDDPMINDLFVEIALDQVRIMEKYSQIASLVDKKPLRGATYHFHTEVFDDLLRWQPFTFSGRLSYKTQLEIEYAYKETKLWGRTLHDTHFSWHDGFPQHPRSVSQNAPIEDQP